MMFLKNRLICERAILTHIPSKKFDLPKPALKMSCRKPCTAVLQRNLLVQADLVVVVVAVAVVVVRELERPELVHVIEPAVRFDCASTTASSTCCQTIRGTLEDRLKRDQPTTPTKQQRLVAQYEQDESNSYFVYCGLCNTFDHRAGQRNDIIVGS